MALPIDVDTSSYENARDIFYDVDELACEAVLTATSGAGDGAGMAGSDSSGVDWSREYDAAAGQALQAGATLTETLGHVGQLLDASGANHANADASSIPGGRGGPTYNPGAKGPSTIYPATPPSSNGSPGDEPHGWFLIAHLMAWTWPNGHQDQLRTVGAAWTRAGQALQNDAPLLSGAISQIESVQSPEVPAAVQTCRDVQTQMTDLGAAYVEIGRTCTDYAGYLDDAHREVIAELESLLEWTIFIEGLGAVGGLISFGGAEVPAQAVEASRIARTAAKVGEILSRMAGLVRGAIGVLTRAAGKVGEILGKLKGLLGKGADRALARVSSKLPGGGRLAERLEQAQVYGKGKLPLEGGPPNGIYVKRAPDGSITNYTEYDADGFATKRVDLQGRAHGSVETPHTVEYQRNVGPDGRIHVGPVKGAGVRPATPDEVP